MTSTDACQIQVEDGWISHPQGRIFRRTWSKKSNAHGASNLAPIVLFHDSLGCVDLWRDFPSRLSGATGRRVIAYDRLGFGRSELMSKRPSLEFVAQESEATFPTVLDQLGLDRFVALGHSVGGGIAIHCAAGFPERCEALVTVSAQVFAEDLTLASIRIARDAFKDAAQVQRLAKYHNHRTNWVLDAWTESWLAPGFADWNLLGILPLVRCPVLALHGEDDEYGSVRHPTLIGELCAGPTTVDILTGIGHAPHRQCADEILVRIQEFLGGLRFANKPSSPESLR
jgi:pimeloyl-ACP methyl ester carboxylesterase